MDNFILRAKQFTLFVFWLAFVCVFFLVVYGVLVSPAAVASGGDKTGLEVIEIIFCAIFICIGGVYGGIFWGSREKAFYALWKSIPKVEIPADINREILMAQWGATFVGVVTIGIWMYFVTGHQLEKMPFVNAGSLFNGIVPLFFAYGIYRKSRVCAVLMLLNFVMATFGKYYGNTSSSPVGGIAISLFLIWDFALGVRAMFKFHKWLHNRNSVSVESASRFEAIPG